MRKSIRHLFLLHLEHLHQAEEGEEDVLKDDQERIDGKREGENKMEEEQVEEAEEEVDDDYDD
eukprot:2848170-Karenia_brevis.AAC.1